MASEQFAFVRGQGAEQLVVAVNAAEGDRAIALDLGERVTGRLVDVLEGAATFDVQGGRATVALPPTWLRVLRLVA